MTPQFMSLALVAPFYPRISVSTYVPVSSGGCCLSSLHLRVQKVEQRRPGSGRRGSGQFMLSGYRVYVWSDAEGWQVDVGDGYSIVNILLTSTLKNDCNGKFYVFLFYCNTKSTHPIPTSVSTPQTY